MTPPVAALTGGTGFLGRSIARTFAEAGWRVRLLTRRAPHHPTLENLSLELVLGGVDDTPALARLVAGADVVIHAAGLIKARNRAEFLSVNRDGSARLAAAVAQAQTSRMVMISSLAARAPDVSLYAESKWAGEDAARARLDETRCVILRPSAIYGPWDREGLAMLKLGAGRFAPGIAAPEPRIAMIHVRDAAAAALAVATAQAARGTYEISDARPDGYGWRELLDVIGTAVGHKPHLVPVPDAAVRAAGAISEGLAGLSGRAAIFGRGKAREILHRDWRIDPAKRLPPDLWQPAIDLETGMRETAEWWLSAGRP